MIYPKLKETLTASGPAAIAVSGGIDSMALARAASLVWADTHVFHAASPAVPKAATERLKHCAAKWGWNLHVIDAGEMADPDYLKNPVNRCFFCKTNLYSRILAETDRPVFSGANVDDLSDYRPGLEAARDFAVRHPYVEAGMGKSGIRGMARELQMGSIAELAASPCLSSRVSTGIPIAPGDLEIIDRIEVGLRAMFGDVAIRCRHVEGGYKIQLEEAVFSKLTEAQIEAVASHASQTVDNSADILGVEPYVRGSAFAVEKQHASFS